ncbi:MAG: zinc ribbon domain-containing protein, partial [Planctomycetes bacterium]|nr:zinc ribbon domain-containing protein [Planctomycetota bacterium]
MPIYEYICKKCGKPFELLVRSDTKVECPGCGSVKVEKRMSTFAAHEGKAPP